MTVEQAQEQFETWRPGVDTLGMVTGHGIDVVDVDTKVGGSLDPLPPFRFYGEHGTPSGGIHRLVRSTGIGKISPLDVNGGHVGDYGGGTAQGGGRLLVYLPGSVRPTYPDGRYTIGEPLDLDALLEDAPDDELVNVLLAAGGSLSGSPGRPAADRAEVEGFLGAHPRSDAEPCPYGRAAVAGVLDTSGVVAGHPMRGRHGWAVRSALRLVELVRAGCATSADIEAWRETLQRIKPEGGTDPHAVLAYAVSNASGHVQCTLHRSPPLLSPEAPEGGLHDLIAHLRTWQDLPDPSHVCAALAVAVTAELEDSEPCWLLLVAPPSSGKTEALRLLDPVASGRLNDVTCAGLLGWTRGKKPRPRGVLVTMGEHGLLTFGDLSSLLATSDRSGRDEVFALLRRVYDGEASRDVQPPGGHSDTGERLEWRGRATVAAAVTGAIDRYTAHADALGPRWLYLRIPERDAEGKRRAAQLARRTRLPELRAEAATLAHGLVTQAQKRVAVIELTDLLWSTIEDAALVTCLGRASVPRDGYGRRDVIGLPEVEEPARVIQQAATLARGALALGLGEDEVARLARRALLDSMPLNRQRVLETLVKAEGELITTMEVSRRAGMHRAVARRTLEDLEHVEVVQGHRAGNEPGDEERDTRTNMWTLDPGDAGANADRVIQAHFEQ